LKFFKLVDEDDFIINNKDYIKNIYNIKIDSRYLLANIGKILSDDILEVVTDISEYNVLTKNLVDVIISTLGRNILIFGINIGNEFISGLIIDNIYNYMEETSSLTLLNVAIIEDDNKYIRTFIDRIIEKMKHDFNMMTDKSIYNIGDAFTLIHENYSETDFSFYKITSKNEILILEI